MNKEIANFFRDMAVVRYCNNNNKNGDVYGNVEIYSHEGRIGILIDGKEFGAKREINI
jgi:hypothetical protein